MRFMNQRDEDQEIDNLISRLEQTDFSQYSNKAKVKQKVLKKITVLPYQKVEGKENQKTMAIEKRSRIMGYKKPLLAACLMIVAIGNLMQTAWGEEMAEKIIRSIRLPHIQAIQCEENEERSFEVPESLKGQIFDSEGNEVKVITKQNCRSLYTKSGEKISHIDSYEQRIVAEAEQQKMIQKMKDSIYEVKEMDQVASYLCFKPKFLTYVPKGYEFDRAELYKDEQGNVGKNSKYVNLYYKNPTTGDEIYIQERYACEETAYEMGSDEEVQKIQLNGVEAILTGNDSLDWEKDGIIIGMHVHQEYLSKEELIKIGEGIK